MKDIIELIAKNANLVDEQKAVLEGTWPKMVIAGPGTGKTTTLVCTAAYLIISRECEPANILALTFSRPGAARMRDQMRVYLGHEISSKVNIYTSDSFAARVIKDSPAVLFGDYVRYRIANNTENILQGVFDKWTHGNRVKVGEILKPYLEHLRTPEEIIDTFTQNKTKTVLFSDQKGVRPSVLLDMGHDYFAQYAYGRIATLAKQDNVQPYYAVLAEAIQHYYEQYKNATDTSKSQEYLKRFLSICFTAAYEHQNLTRKQVALGSLKHYAQCIFLADPYQASIRGKMYTHVLYDEFQDISIQEYTLIKSVLAQQKDNAFRIAAFGDPNQSIYMFRRALGAAAYELLILDYIRSGEHDEYRNMLRQVLESDPQALPDWLNGKYGGRRLIYYLLQNHRAMKPELDKVAHDFLEISYRLLLDAQKGMIPNTIREQKRIIDAIMNDYAHQKAVMSTSQKKDALQNKVPAVFSQRYLHSIRTPMSAQGSRACYYIDKSIIPSQAKLIGQIMERVYKLPTQDYRQCSVVVNNQKTAQEVEYELTRKGIPFIPYTNSFIYGDAFRYVYAAIRMGMNEHRWDDLTNFVRLHLNAEGNIENANEALKQFVDTYAMLDEILPKAAHLAENIKGSTLGAAFQTILESQKAVLESAERVDRDGIVRALQELSATVLSNNQVFHTTALIDSDLRRYLEKTGSPLGQEHAQFTEYAKLMLTTIFDFGRETIMDGAALSAWLEWLGSVHESQDKNYNINLQDMILRFEREGIPIVQILSPRQVKGLEFDLLVMLDADSLTSGESLQEITNVYYVNLTRARKLLIAVGNGNAQGEHNAAIRTLFEWVKDLNHLKAVLNHISLGKSSSEGLEHDSKRVSRILFSR